MNYRQEIEIPEKKLRYKTFLSFSVFILLVLGAVLAWKKLRQEPREAGAIQPLRTILNYNENFFSNFLTDDHLAKTFPVSAAVQNVRVNGNLGMSDNFNPATWKLQVLKNAGDTLFVTLDQIRALPKTELVFDFKCIEGWSQVTHWAGVKFSDFAAKYNLDVQTQMKYVGLVTPDKKYYVGID
ncbi:MAG: molybdopterin-dependent oxidoreductase, partial [Ginsengibacter sp.]